MSGANNWFSPYCAERRIGTITKVLAATALANLPDAISQGGRQFFGSRLGAGELGEFVFIECGELAVLGRITEIGLPSSDRLTVEPGLNGQADSNPFGTIQLLTTVVVQTGELRRGIVRHPRLGAQAFSADSKLVKAIVEGKADPKTKRFIELAELPESDATKISVSPEHLFGRHCAVLGATGGGKSWTIARMLEEITRNKGKAILIDATGEHHDTPATHHYVGARGTSEPAASTEVVFPYTYLVEDDLFAIFRPSPGAQAPKLREAIKSLKLAKLDPVFVQADSGLLCKAGRNAAKIGDIFRKHKAALTSPRADFDISLLAEQIRHECYKPFINNGSWGVFDESSFGYCISLVNRIETFLAMSDLDFLFNPQKKATIPKIIDDFLANKNAHVLRISLEGVPFGVNAREILANAIGRTLLKKARDGGFRDVPLIVFLDEAHQFLNKQIGDEFLQVQLDAFGLIAKEGRKYGLTTVIATQRPRDVPEDVLSQMGTMIVHRLVSHFDRETVERASGEIDRAAAAFLPVLGQGEALLIGVDFPIPLAVKVIPPIATPKSKGPDFQGAWGT
jgi:hypothetical protein